MPDASCVLTGTLPFSFALSHSAITEYATKDPEGVDDRDSAANSARPSGPHGGRVYWGWCGPAQKLASASGHANGIMTSKKGQCLVPQEKS